jgi:hypothetical protein
VSGFVDLLIASSMIFDDQEGLGVNCFKKAQLDPDTVWELQDIVFCEFVDAVSHLALRSIENSSGLSDAKKIRMAFNFMSELQNDSGQHHHRK